MVVTYNTKSEADCLADESETIACELTQENASLFTAGELFSLCGFLTKARWGTSAEQEKKNLEWVTQLKRRVTERKKQREAGA